jgi:hypothetical protein
MTLTKTKPANRAGAGNLRLEALREGTLAQTAQQRLGMSRLLRSGGAKTIIRTYAGNGYHYEADEVMRCVREGRKESDLMPLSQSVAMAALMDKAKASWSA